MGVELRCGGVDVLAPGFHQGFAVLGYLVQEFVAARLVSVEEVDEVFDCWRLFFALLALGFADFEHVCEEALEVPEGVAEIDGLVDVADHRCVGVDSIPDSCCEVIWVPLAQHPNDLLAIADCEGQGEIL